jgi:hypothetical protein
MTRGTNPRNPLFRGIVRFEEQTQMAAGREAAFVTWTLKKLKCEAAAKRWFTESGATDWTFPLLSDLPGFPMRLQLAEERSLPVHRDPKYVHPVWFKSFLDLPIVREYLETYDPDAESRPQGLIFSRRGFARGLVLHTGDFTVFVPPNAACHVFRGGDHSRVSYVVQSYASLIDGIRDEVSWSIE